LTVFSRHFWRSLVPVIRKPLLHQPLLIAAYLIRAVLWTVLAAAVCLGRLATVVVGQGAFVAGIVLCLIGYGYFGAPLGVVGLVASRLAA
jgi:hypothetical protein